VAVGFLPAAPPGLERIRTAPAGCGYWKEASQGRAFYTTPQDHDNCPIGAFTHGVSLSPAKMEELQGMLGTMIELKYIRSDEVSKVPHRAEPMQVAAYAPLGEATFEPDVVVFRGNVRQIMLLSEAARAAGVFEAASMMGRPACAMLPQAIDQSSAVASVGCIGNRVYTGLGDDELYLAVPGRAVESVLEQLPTIVQANVTFETFHRQRAAALA
jgi:uncharacterized protein (DUF169 family)